MKELKNTEKEITETDLNFYFSMIDINSHVILPHNPICCVIVE